MKKFVFGVIVGAVMAALGIGLFSGAIYSRAERKLIQQWRQVQPGSTLAELETSFGKPTYLFAPGTGFPDWAKKSVPETYAAEHGLAVYMVPFTGPQLLLVYFGNDGRVTFVSSTWT